MIGKFALSALLASASALVVRADVVPSAPGPGTVYNAGATCRIEWDGDQDSNTNWKNMAIELMTGDNFDMIHLTTVATNQDGTISSFFEHPCPEVVPFSAIYFYQFTSPLSPNKTWTTRFTIASSTGASVPPQNPTQPGTNAAIAWGVGALADPSTAVPAPGAAGGLNSTTTSAAVLTTTTQTALTTSSPPLTNSPLATTKSTASHSVATSATSATTNSTVGASANNAALGSLTVDSRVWQAAVALGASAMTFTFLL